MNRSAETLGARSTQLVHSAHAMLEKLSPQAVVAIAIGGAALLAVVLWSRRKRFPPGDWSLPFVGPLNIGAPPRVKYSNVKSTTLEIRRSTERQPQQPMCVCVCVVRAKARCRT